MKIIGITGGIGSGKSEIGNILKNQYNAHLIIADSVAHKLMEKGNTSYKLITEHFGNNILNNEEQIDRSKLSKLVFNHKEKLTKLNSLVHPYVKEEIIKEIKQVEEANNKKLIIIEAALLIEDGYKNICDELWYIYTDESTRRSRLITQRDYTDDKINSIIKSQLSDEEFRNNCDRIIDNNGNIEETKNILNSIISSEFLQ